MRALAELPVRILVAVGLDGDPDALPGHDGWTNPSCFGIAPWWSPMSVEALLLDRGVRQRARRIAEEIAAMPAPSEVVGNLSASYS